MTAPILLIAEREFRAYVATVSFWVALAIGPLAIAGALALATIAAHPPPPTPIAVVAPSPALQREAATALAEAARLDGRSVRAASAARAGAPALVVATTPEGALVARFEGQTPLSPAARALAVRTLERDALARRLGVTVRDDVAPQPAALPAAAAGAAAAARFALVMMLWLTLTGSLGMLLQAVVRERASRALEGLLAAAPASDIVFGKWLGVGAVSLLVVGCWLGSAAALAPLAPRGAGLAGAAFGLLANPLTLARAALIYLLAYAFYGLLTIAVGAAARDVAQAQNLSRPMFAVLLAAFFVALASAAGAGAGLGWMAWLPPFTPFMLLTEPPGAMGAGGESVALAELAAAAVLCARIAVRGLLIGPPRRAHVQKPQLDAAETSDASTA